jgi:hypothetical protein
MTRIPARLAPLALLLLAAPFTTGAEGGCGSLSVEDLEDSQVTYTEIASFSGTILEFGSGDPIEGASVRVADKRATSDDIGFFYIANIQAGEHALSLSAGGYLPRTETIELLAGANALDPIYLVPSGGAGGSGGWAGEGGSGGSIGGAGGSGGGGSAGEGGFGGGGGSAGEGGFGGGGGSGGTTGVGRIDIYLTGDATPHAFSDGLSGQTPRDYLIAVGAYEVLTSADDPTPVPCFAHASPVVADLSLDNLMGSCETASIPTGLYTHGRVQVDWASYTVDAVYQSTFPIPGEYTFFRAYSDTDVGGVSYLAGEGSVTFSYAAGSDTYPWVFTDLPQVPGVQYDVVNGKLWITFPFTHALPIDQSNTDLHWARMNWEIFNAFRWSELAYPGYSTGTWDTSLNILASEPVHYDGVTGYYVTSSVD